MKLKHYIVEYVCYANKDGYPGLGTDPETMERVHFSTKQEANRFIKKFMNGDPDYIQQWIASIRLHTIVEKIELVKFPVEWERLPVSKKARTKVRMEVPISDSASSFVTDWGDDLLGVTPQYWEDTHVGNASKDDRCHCEIEADYSVLDDECPIHGDKQSGKDPLDTFQA